MLGSTVLTRVCFRGLVAVVLCVSAGVATGQDWESLPFTEHATFQAVNPDGSPAYTGGFPLRMQGVLLNDPGSIFDNTPNFIPVNWPQTAFQFGGIQQVYFQAVEPGDLGGTAMFLAQSLGNHPANQDDFFSYTNAEWLAELERVNRDPDTGHVFAAGDLVEVRARIGLHFSGKFNVNEAHDNAPQNDFDVVLIEAGYGVPLPQVIRLVDIKAADDTDRFDPTRATGGERYQSQWVTLRKVQVMDPENWAAEQQVVVSDGTRTLPLLLGTDPAFDSEPAPEGWTTITGIMDQEASPSPFGGLNGYRLIATARTDFAGGTGCPVDVNGDGQTDAGDLVPLAGAWGSADAAADLNEDGTVDLGDYALLQVEGGCNAL
jgi:hypothetical protein